MVVCCNLALSASTVLTYPDFCHLFHFSGAIRQFRASDDVPVPTYLILGLFVTFQDKRLRSKTIFVQIAWLVWDGCLVTSHWSYHYVVRGLSATELCGIHHCLRAVFCDYFFFGTLRSCDAELVLNWVSMPSVMCSYLQFCNNWNSFLFRCISGI